MLHIALQVMDDEDDEINDNNQMAVDPAEDEVEVRTSRLIDEYEIADDRVKILTNSSPRVQKLLYHLKEHVEENARPIKGLIFVKRRTTAKLLCHVINRYANALPKLPLRTDFMVGNNSNIPNSIETILSNQSNKKVLEKFKRDEINLIIATSVLEEGIDLQECNLVICFDAPETFRSYVQSKGRARMKDSAYVVFTEASKQTEMSNKMREWNEINDILRQVSDVSKIKFIENERLKTLSSQFVIRSKHLFWLCGRHTVEYVVLTIFFMTNFSVSVLGGKSNRSCTTQSR